jgi:nitrate/nitrite-specific signal transduction histidine kinase
MLSRRDYISVEFRRSELRERNKELSFLIEMSDFLSSSVNLKELSASALSKVLEHFDLDAGRIYLQKGIKPRSGCGAGKIKEANFISPFQRPYNP